MIYIAILISATFGGLFWIFNSNGGIKNKKKKYSKCDKKIKQIAFSHKKIQIK